MFTWGTSHSALTPQPPQSKCNVSESLTHSGWSYKHVMKNRFTGNEKMCLILLQPFFLILKQHLNVVRYTFGQCTANFCFQTFLRAAVRSKPAQFWTKLGWKVSNCMHLFENSGTSLWWTASVPHKNVQFKEAFKVQMLNEEHFLLPGFSQLRST